MTNLKLLLKEVAEPWFDTKLGALADRLGIPGKVEILQSQNPKDWGKIWIGRVDETGRFGVCVGFDYHRYDKSNTDHPPLVCDLDANIPLDKAQHEVPARDRIYNALTRTFSKERVTLVKDYPNKKPVNVQDNSILVLQGDNLAYRMIDICVRGGSAPEESEDQLRAALEDLQDQLDTFISAVDISWGALHGEAPTLTMDAITGWCGEVAVFHREKRKNKHVEFSSSWYAPYDLEGENNERIEVKASRRTGASTFTLSTNEVAIALTASTYRLVLVKIPGEIVQSLYDALKSESTGGRKSKEIPEISRLRQIFGNSDQRVDKNRSIILDAIERLSKLDDDKFIFDERNPFQWLAEPDLARNIINRRMSMSFPFSPEWNSGELFGTREGTWPQ